MDQTPIVIAHFLEWPAPLHYGQAKTLYEAAMGAPVRWRPFDSGRDMSAAMARGEVQMAYAQGFVPFTLAVSKGLPLKVVAIALSYAENDNCVVHRSVAATDAADRAAKLAGARVAVPFGTVTHYKLLRSLEVLGIPAQRLQLIDLAAADAAAALARQEVDIACGWGGALQRMLRHGDVLIAASELENRGVRVFDVVSVTERFAETHPDKVSAFLRLTHELNRRFAKAPADMLPVIARASGMRRDAAEATLSKFAFPTPRQQLGPHWLGAATATYMRDVARFFVAQNQLPRALDDYTPTIDTRFLEAAVKPTGQRQE